MMMTTDGPGLVTIRVLSPKECSARELESFGRLVREGGEVRAGGLESRIADAKWLAFAQAQDTFVGVAALKSPRPAYRDRVFAEAGVVALAPQFSLEFGWAYVVPPWRRRGVGRALLQHTLDKVAQESVFATAAADNAPVHQLLRSAGFEIVGIAFPSARRRANLNLWVRPGRPAGI